AYAASQIQYLYSDKVERLAIKKISGGGTLNGPFHWGGVVDQYFAAVFLPQDPPTAAMVTLRNALDLPKVPKNPQETTRVEVLGHRHPDADHQHRVAAAAHLADEVDAEDAEGPAADQVHPGEIQEVQHARSAQAGNAAGDIGAVQEGRREPGGGLPANADPVALFVCLLCNAG